MEREKEEYNTAGIGKCVQIFLGTEENWKETRKLQKVFPDGYYRIRLCFVLLNLNLKLQ